MSVRVPPHCEPAACVTLACGDQDALGPYNRPPPPAPTGTPPGSPQRKRGGLPRGRRKLLAGRRTLATRARRYYREGGCGRGAGVQQGVAPPPPPLFFGEGEPLSPPIPNGVWSRSPQRPRPRPWRSRAPGRRRSRHTRTPNLTVRPVSWPGGDDTGRGGGGAPGFTTPHPIPLQGPPRWGWTSPCPASSTFTASPSTPTACGSAPPSEWRGGRAGEGSDDGGTVGGDADLPGLPQGGGPVPPLQPGRLPV